MLGENRINKGEQTWKAEIGSRIPADSRLSMRSYLVNLQHDFREKTLILMALQVLCTGT